MTVVREAAGFFGKVPSHGDFVARRLPAAFTGPWDAWLQAGLADSRARLGAAWLPTYLNSPIWRFALAAGVCGAQAWGGVMMPSVDRVGRYFPFTIACATAGVATTVPGPWYAAIEELALSALGADFALPQFDAALCVLTPAPLGHAPRRAALDVASAATFWLGDTDAPCAPAMLTSEDWPAASLFTDLLRGGPAR